MDKNMYKEAVEVLEIEEVAVTLITEEGEYEIDLAENFLGGGSGYISVALGNIAYETAEEALNATLRFLEGELGKEVKEVEFG